MKRLTVDVSELALIRSELKTDTFDPVRFAVMCEMAGCQGIVAALDSGGKLMNERDLRLLVELKKSYLNLHISPEPNLLKLALNYPPDMVTLVDMGRKPGEMSPLPLETLTETLEGYIPDFKANNISVAVFILPEINLLKQLSRVEIDYVEFDCREYTGALDSNEQLLALDKLKSATLAAGKLGLGVNFWGGIDYLHLGELSIIPHVEDITMGRPILRRALEVGIMEAVQTATQQIQIFQRPV